MRLVWSYITQFSQPDTLVPDYYNPLDWNRYQYARANPLKYTDPSGHKPCDDIGCPGEIDPFKLAEGIRTDQGITRYWDGLTKEEQQILQDDGWDPGSFNDYMLGGNAAPVDVWHDPATYIVGLFVGGRILTSMVAPVADMVVYASETGSTCFYRGGCDLTPKPGEVSIDQATGLLKTTKGVSLNLDPTKVEQFGGAFRVDFFPAGLNIIQRGVDPNHFELVPRFPMPQGDYIELLQQVVLNPLK